MGALIGLLAGLGLVLVVWTFGDPTWRPRRRDRRDGLRGLLARAGLGEVTPRGLAGLCTVAFVLATLVMSAISGVLAIGLVFGALAAVLPIAVLRGRALRRLREHAELWPDAVGSERAVSAPPSRARDAVPVPMACVDSGEVTCG